MKLLAELLFKQTLLIVQEAKRFAAFGFLLIERGQHSSQLFERLVLLNLALSEQRLQGKLETF